MAPKDSFTEGWLNAWGDAETAGRAGDRVVVQLEFGDGETLRALCEGWLESAVRGTLFCVTFCENPESGARSLRAFEARGSAWAAELLLQWPQRFPGQHRMEFPGRRLVVDVGLGNRDVWISRVSAQAELFLLDRFIFVSGESAKRMTRHLARLAIPLARVDVKNASQVPTSAFEPWREALESSGFRGSPGREAGTWQGRFVGKRTAERPVAFLQRRAVVVGGGVAGASLAARLGARGWSVDLFEKSPELAAGASGNLAAVCVPMLSRDDGLAARLSRACFLDFKRELDRLRKAGLDVLHGLCGVVQFPRRIQEAAALEGAVKKNAFPHEYVRWIERSEVANMLGCLVSEVSTGAAFFPDAGWVNPASLCRARLEAAGNVRIHLGVEVGDVRSLGEHWVVLDGAGREILRAPVVVFANGHAALERAWHGHLRFKRVRGQVTHIEAAEMAAVSHVVCGDGYVTPVVQGRISVGATYDFNEDAAEILEVSGRENLARIPLLLPGRMRPDARFAGEGRVGFRLLTADRLPVAGALVEGEYDGAREWERLEEVPRQRGLYGVLGLGSRGVLWSGLVAEYVAAEISGEPSPLERDLAGAMDPARWVLRSQRERR